MQTLPYIIWKGFPKEFEEYKRCLENEKDEDYKYLKDLFYSILKEDKNNWENIYDWDIGNKILNTITQDNTRQKTFFIKDKSKKEINIFDNNNSNLFSEMR